VNHHIKQRRILSFWFGDDPLRPLDNSAVWFAKNSETDTLISELFGEMWDEARTGAYDDWSKSPEGALALIILCDQLSRNLFRDDEMAFSQDARALKTAQIAISRGFEQAYSPIQRLFLYLPFEHSEDIEMQRRSVEKFAALLDSTTDENERRYITSALDFAERHKIIIERFGRFPHRNEILGRPSSRDEQEFLKHWGSSASAF
jgi:uncharacterized protein (DUF924 family)